MTGHVGNDFLGIIINQYSSRRDSHDHMLGICPVLALITALYSAVSFKMALITEIHQCPQPFIHTENHIAAPAAVTAGRPAFRHVLLTAKSHETVAAIAAFYINLSLIYEHEYSPSLHLQRHPQLYVSLAWPPLLRLHDFALHYIINLLLQQLRVTMLTLAFE
ncbi:hypothetical protein D3C80_1473430 [compost metagenome]